MANFKSVAYVHNQRRPKYKIAIIVAQIVVKFQKFVSGSDM